MHTLKLKIDDKVYDKLIWLLGKFTKDEIEIIMDENETQETKKYLQDELNDMISGKASYLSVNETEQRLETIIRKHEGRI